MKDSSRAPSAIALRLAYDGSRYHGWQMQPGCDTIQERLQKALGLILKRDVTVIGSGRTDAGVHAAGQVAHFHVQGPLDLYRLKASLNGLLPPDIRIFEIKEADPAFHAQYSATAKTYHYHLCCQAACNPIGRAYVAHVRHKLDSDRLAAAAALFIGTHDFTSFANAAHQGSASRNAVRTLHRLDVFATKEGYRLEFEADGFLYRMVRNIAGTLIDVASGRLGAEEVPALIKARDRRLAGSAAPARGLCLMQVTYPQELLKWEYAQNALSEIPQGQDALSG